ncbi:MAG TPA: LptF/LptG family permease [Holophagaceae bacterium]|nr:LptF/LptG family permease [Holophagaceae bacterium]
MSLQPRLFTRYLLRRWSLPLLGALLFYGCLLLAQEMVMTSQEIFRQGAPLRWLFPLLLSALPDILGMVLPMAAVLGGLLGTQNLMEGSELVAAQGLGISRFDWLRPYGLLAGLMLVLSALNAHWAVPASSRLQIHLRERMIQEAKARFLKPGGAPWHPLQSPQTSLWADPEGQLHVMEVAEGGVKHIVSKKFTYSLKNNADNSWDLQVAMADLSGVVYRPQASAVLHLHQDQQSLDYHIPAPTRILKVTHFRHWETLDLWKDGGREALIELSRRFTLPITSAALLILGIALSFGHPRFHKGGAIVKSLGVIALYYLVMKTVENQFLAEKIKTPVALYIQPFLFLVWGWWLLRRRLRPHHSNRWAGRWKRWLRPFSNVVEPISRGLGSGIEHLEDRLHGQGVEHNVLDRWAASAWLRQWSAALGSLLVLNLLIEYSNLAGDLSEHHVGLHVFLAYWVWNLPTLLPTLGPISFLLGWVLTLSESATSQEWVALRAGGVSLVQFIRSSRWAWGSVLAATFILNVGIGPVAARRSRELYQRILDRPSSSGRVNPWLYLGSTGVLWRLEGSERWGFPLKQPGEAPILLHWKLGSPHSEALAWGGARLVPGPPAEKLFPALSLRSVASPEEAPTLELAQWQTWAPAPEQAYLLWDRLLGWLAGPCLVLACLSFAFPGPRDGRGQALGFALVMGLLFLGLQALFGGAAKAGELPAVWGSLAPCLLLISTWLLRMRGLRT